MIISMIYALFKPSYNNQFGNEQDMVLYLRAD